MSFTPEQIETLANSIREKYHIMIPILSMNEVVATMGGTIKPNKFAYGYENHIRKTEEESFEIQFSPYMDAIDYNYMIAIQLGHLVLHMGFDQEPNTWKERTEEEYYNAIPEIEQEAATFALALLMPEKEYREQWAQTPNLKTMANHFHVSITQVWQRSRDLKIEYKM